MITYAEACLDPNLFGPWFDGESWATWRAVDKSIFGERLDETEMVAFREITGRDEAPTERASEVWIIAGRRSGKDVKAASIATYLATIGADLFGFLDRLVPGERGVVQLLAVDSKQAAVCMSYAKAMFGQPMLEKLVQRETADTIELTSGVAIEITTNDQRRLRGRTVLAAIFDEVAHWKSEDTTNPDEAVYRAIKPSMATMPGALLIGISSPYARRGLLYRKYQNHYAKSGPVLVVKAPTWRMNLTLQRDGETIAEAYDSDPVWAAAEYGAEFRTDVEAYLSREAIDACIEVGTRERLPERGHVYTGFVDPSGGSADSMTLAIAHAEGVTTVLDCVREVRPPFSPESVVAEFSDLLKAYRCPWVKGDRYGGEWVAEAFRKFGIYYSPSEWSKSQLYVDFLPLVNSRAVDLLEHQKMIAQMAALERRVARGGRDSVDHPPGGHDDVANAVAGASVFASRATKGFAIAKKQADMPPLGSYRLPMPNEYRARPRIKI